MENKIGVATYSVQDDKIRIYFDSRIDKELWNEFKKLGFTWTMKQESDLVATWNCKREDFAKLHCGDLQNEKSDMLDRSADRAERFSGYLDNRLNDAEKGTDLENTIGMQSESKANKIADRIERIQDKANLNLSKAKYWQSRINAVIRFADFKESEGLRHRRIRTLKKELTPCLKTIEFYKSKIEKYENMTDEDFSKIEWRNNNGEIPSRLELIRRYKNELENGNSARWAEHLQFRINFEKACLFLKCFRNQYFQKCFWLYRLQFHFLMNLFLYLYCLKR